MAVRGLFFWSRAKPKTQEKCNFDSKVNSPPRENNLEGGVVYSICCQNLLEGNHKAEHQPGVREKALGGGKKTVSFYTGT